MFPLAACRPKNLTSWLNSLFKDIFLDSVEAGALNDTPATPGPGNRTAVDTESKLSVTEEGLVCAGGKATPAWGDPGVWEPAITRELGRAVIFGPVTVVDATKVVEFGLDLNQSGEISEIGLKISADTILAIDNGELSASLGIPLDNTAYYFAIVLGNNGAVYFWRTLSGSWARLGATSKNQTLNLYPAISNYNASLTLGKIIVPSDRLAQTLSQTTEWGEGFADDGSNAWGDDLVIENYDVLNRYIR